MYQISSNVRKYSPTPIVEIMPDKSEKIVFVCTLPKKDGNELSTKIVELLNQIK